MKIEKNSFYGVFGLGLSGKATLDFLNQQGYKALAWDDSAENIKSSDKNYKNIEFCDIKNPEWKNIDCLILSPGIPLHYPEPHPIVSIAKENGIEIICDVELFYRHFSDNKYIGITGTNGKSTTASLISHIFDSNNLPYKILGNIGTPALSVTPRPEDIIIIEMSSYQLDLVKNLHFDVAILLNITPDHLERHGNMENYIESKFCIFHHQDKTDHAIINKSLETQDIGSSITCFSGNELLDTGISVSKDGIYDNRKYLAVNLPHSLSGSHNHENLAASYASVKSITTLTEREIIKSIESFKGLSHRMQLVGQIGHLQFINDSKGTNFESTKQALNSFKNIYWIAGGKAKAGGIQGIEKFAEKIKLVFLIGESQKLFADTLEKHNIPYYYSKSLNLAFVDATQEAQRDTQDNVILLSPSASSLDQWKNFEERGNSFIRLVEKYVTTHKKAFHL
jgi:UDP-N-acetylmuramoylalanine--D-glutamate ligase